MLVLLLTAAVTGTWAETINLSAVTANLTAQNGDVLTGTLGANVKISIADGATVTLNDVTINGDNSSSYYWAGINCEGDAVIVLTGNNTVKGFYQNQPGIHIAEGKTLTIRGDGSLTASSNGLGAGIGGGQYVACGNIVIEGGTINATGGDNAAAIGGGDGAACGNITITNGVTAVTAIKAETADNSIGAGYAPGTCGTITIGGVVRENITESPYRYLALADNKDNSPNITTYNKQQADVTLKRTLQTGGWNTFCAPFSTTTPTGWTVKELTGSSSSDGTLTLTFATASSIVAGKPYLVKVTSAVENPTFSGVTITGSTTTAETSYADFVPVMNPTALTAGDKTVLFVADGNKLTYPTANGNINAFRAYFHLKGAAATAPVHAFGMSFDDDATGIESIEHGTLTIDHSIYDLQGRRMANGQSLKKGVYLMNGRKVVVK